MFHSFLKWVLKQARLLSTKDGYQAGLQAHKPSQAEPSQGLAWLVNYQAKPSEAEILDGLWACQAG